MSLLMDALRKAEQAKRQAESAAKSALDPPLELEAGPAELAGRAPATPAGPPLPELPTRLELLDDQFGNVTGGAPGAKSAASTASPRKPAAEQVARERQAARQVFAAKEPKQPSRRGFYVGLVATTLIAVAGVGGYFWWQLQPRSMLLATAPPAGTPVQARGPGPAGAPSSVAADVPPATFAPTGSATAAASAGTMGSTPGNVQPVQPAAGATPATAAASVVKRDSDAPPVRILRPSRPAVVRGQMADAPVAATRVADETPVRISRSRPLTDPGVERGYQLFQSGNTAAARSAYQQVLRRDPYNADALNGLAAIALRSGAPQSAEVYYQRALEADPQDATAQAGLIGLRGAADPLQAESRLKTLAAAQPDAHAGHFALGNLYAAQGRWHEAQQAYFRAHTAAPENPDYQFNLAVSLDQLRQPRLALQYYQGALSAAAARHAAFDQAQAAARIRELQQ